MTWKISRAEEGHLYHDTLSYCVSCYQRMCDKADENRKRFTELWKKPASEVI